MSKKITFILFLLLTISGSINQLSAQDDTPSVKSGTKKSLRAYRRAQNQALDAITTTNMVKTRNFTYYPTTLESTGAPTFRYQNISLTSYYYVTITPTQLSVMLPIFGGSNMTGQPVIWKELDFFTGNYTYNFKQNDRGTGWTVTVTAMDTWSFNTFTFEFDISNRAYARLALSTPFVGPAEFSGSVATN